MWIIETRQMRDGLKTNEWRNVWGMVFKTEAEAEREVERRELKFRGKMDRRIVKVD